METVIDPQATGWRDDASQSGIVRTEIVGGNLIPIAFRPNNYNVTTTGTTAVTYNAANIVNFDGTMSGLFCTVPAASGLGSGARLVFFVNGNTLALRYTEQGGFPLADMSINVDGVNYDIPIPQTRDRTANTVFTNAPAEMQSSIISRSLGEGSHFVEIFLNQHPTIDKRVYLHGFMACESAGYQRALSGIRANTIQITSSTSYQNISAVSMAAVRKIFCNNPTVGAITISVRSSSLAANPLWVKSVAAGDTAELDFGGLCFDISTMQILGSAAGVICTIIGAQ